MFWNVAELTEKDEEFGKKMKKWNIIGLTKTLIKEKRWEVVKRRMSKKYKWTYQPTKAKNRKGRAMGRIITEVKKNIKK